MKNYIFHILKKIISSVNKNFKHAYKSLIVKFIIQAREKELKKSRIINKNQIVAKSYPQERYKNCIFLSNSILFLLNKIDLSTEIEITPIGVQILHPSGVQFLHPNLFKVFLTKMRACASVHAHTCTRTRVCMTSNTLQWLKIFYVCKKGGQIGTFQSANTNKKGEKTNE